MPRGGHRKTRQRRRQLRFFLSDSSVEGFQCRVKCYAHNQEKPEAQGFALTVFCGRGVIARSASSAAELHCHVLPRTKRAVKDRTALAAPKSLQSLPSIDEFPERRIE